MLTEEEIYLKMHNKEVNGRQYNFFNYKFDEDENLNIKDMELFGIDSLSVSGKSELINLSILKKFSYVRGLRLNSHRYTYIDILQEFKDLEYFQILDLCDAEIPFDKFNKLHSAEVNYDHKTCQLIFNNPSIEFLKIHNYKQKSSADLVRLKTLKQLTLEQCKLGNLDFLDQLPLLRCFRISHNRNLTSIQGLSRVNDLRKVEIAYCKKIEDWSSLSQVNKLNAVILEDCGEIDSLAFLESLPDLKLIRVFGDTIVRDGLLKALLEKESLEYFKITLHKHYDITQDSLKRFGFVNMTDVMKEIDLY